MNNRWLSLMILLLVWLASARPALANEISRSTAIAVAECEPTLAVSTTVVWDTVDANGKGTGFITAKQGPNGDWTWERYAKQPDGTHKKVDSGTATLTSSNPIEYAWTSNETEHTGTAKIDEGGSTGKWTNTTTGESVDIKKAS